MRTTHFLYCTLFLLLAACDEKDPIYETPYPDRGTITLITDWSRIESGLTVPDSYTVRVGDYSVVLSGTTNTIDNYFVADNYRAYIYNTASQIAVSGTTATALYTAGTIGWFFSCAMYAKVEADTDQTFTALMRQQVIEMSFTVTPSGGSADKITAITGRLGGVAGAMDIDTQARSAATNANLLFTKQADGKWKATLRLLGITGDQQPLTTTVKFVDNEPADVTDTTDINDEIQEHFNDDGSPIEPAGGGGGGDSDINLGTEIVVTPTESGLAATITGWKANEGSGKAD